MAIIIPLTNEESKIIYDEIRLKIWMKLSKKN